MQLSFEMDLLYTVATWYTYKTPSIPATQIFFLFLKHIEFVFSTGPLHFYLESSSLRFLHVSQISV